MESIALILLSVVTALLAFGLLAVRFGVDSRDLLIPDRRG